MRPLRYYDQDFMAQAVVVLKGFYYTVISKKRFSLQLGQIISVAYPRQTGQKTKRKSTLGPRGAKHIGNSPHMIRNNANCEKLNCLETIRRRNNKDFVIHSVFYYSFDRKDGI